MQERRHLAAGHHHVRAETVVGGGIASPRHPRRRQPLDVGLERAPVVVTEIGRGPRRRQVGEGPMDEGRHLTPGDGVVGTEERVGRGVATAGYACRRQPLDLGLEGMARGIGEGSAPRAGTDRDRIGPVGGARHRDRPTGYRLGAAGPDDVCGGRAGLEGHFPQRSDDPEAHLEVRVEQAVVGVDLRARSHLIDLDPLPRGGYGVVGGTGPGTQGVVAGTCGNHRHLQSRAG